MTDKICIVYLATGMSLLGKVIQSDDQGITMHETLEMRCVPVGSQVGEIIMGNQRFFDKNIQISKSQILCIATDEDIEDELKYRYEKNLNSLRANKSGLTIV